MNCTPAKRESSRSASCRPARKRSANSLAAILGPGRKLAAALKGPGGKLGAVLKTIEDKAKEKEGAPRCRPNYQKSGISNFKSEIGH